MMGLPTPSRRQLFSLGVVVASLALTGCALKFTGGGTVVSTDGTNSASFGFTYKVTNTTTGAGQAQGAYHDSYAPSYPLGGVQLKFAGLLWGDTSTSDNCFYFGGRGIEGEVSYTSQNRNYPGSGTASLSACDDGEPGVASHDYISIEVDSGPYSGYGDGGSLTGGNLQAH